MLPSFRLIAATFFCGFLAVFAGLRMAASLNDFHEALPVMAAHAAPVTVSPAADREARRGVSSVPMMYDLRFAVSTMSPTLVRATPSVFDRPAPPLSIVPPEDIAANTPAMAEPEPPQPESTVAAIPELPNLADSQPATDTVEPPVAEAEIEAMLAVKTAAIAPQVTDQAAPAVEATLADLPVPEVSRTVSIDVLAQDAAADDATDSVKSAEPPPATEPQAAKLKKAVAKVKRVRKKHIRTAHRAAANNPLSNPFGGQPQPR